MITPHYEDPRTVGGLLARFWRRLDCRPDMAPDHRRHLLYLYTYSYGSQLRIRKGHSQATRAEWSRDVRGQTINQFTAPCWACGEAWPAHWHHIIPVARGGDNRRANLVPLCKACHRAAHHLELDARKTALEVEGVAG